MQTQITDEVCSTALGKSFATRQQDHYVHQLLHRDSDVNYLPQRALSV